MCSKWILIAIFFCISFNTFECSNLSDSQLFKDCGKIVNRNDSPWKVAIFRKDGDNKSKYVCGGTLITKNLIITASNCVYDITSSSHTKPDQLRVVLNSDNFNNQLDDGEEYFDVKEVMFHDEWNAMEIQVKNNFALLRLNSTVTFSELIQPICVMNNDENVPKQGKISGWKMINRGGVIGVRATNIEQKIIAKNDNFLENTFSAKNVGNDGCGGDLGGGFFIEVEGKMFLKGILISSKGEKCSEKESALYTDVTKYFDFIEKHLNTMELFCKEIELTGNLNMEKFMSNKDSFTQCFDENFENLNVDYRVTNIKTNLQPSQLKNVQFFSFSRKFNHLFNVDKQLIEKTFPNLHQLIVDLKNFANSPDPIELRKFIENLGKIDFLVVKNYINDENAEKLFNFEEPENFKLMEIKNCSFESQLPSNIFTKFTSLRYLMLSDSTIKVKTLPEDIFGSNVNLEYLAFENNKLESLPENIFDPLIKISYLSLIQNEFEEFPPKIFHKLTNLETLGLYENQLTTIHPDLLKMNTKLQKLYIQENRIKDLPENVFETLVNLKELSLESNEIEELPLKIFSKLSKLDVLWIDRNKINSIQPELFNGLAKLQILYLGRNRIKTIPENIFNPLKKLKAVFMFKNEIEILPKKIFKKNLELVTVYVWGNKLKEVYFDFSTLPKVRELVIGSMGECVDLDPLKSTSKIHQKAQFILDQCKKK